MDQILSRASIHADAYLAAKFVAAGGAAIWRAAFSRHLHEMRAEEGTEASA